LNKINLEKMVKRDPSFIGFIDSPSKEVQLAAVREDGWAIQFIDSPSEEVQLAAVRQDGWITQHIKSPTEAVKLEAVRQDGWTIRLIPKKNRTHIIKKLLSEGHELSAKFIKDYKKLYKKAKIEFDIESSLEKDFE
jgi:hypothetical protein